MAMEKCLVVRDTYSRSITALGYNPGRKEITIGCEDGMVKCWEFDGERLTQSGHAHGGWVTDFLYWNDTRIMLSAGNDGSIVAWGHPGGVSDKIQVGTPVYCMTINMRRYTLVCGCKSSIRVFGLDKEKDSGHHINTKILYIADEHTDLVRIVFCWESRIYSAGYDKRIIVYDSSYTSGNTLQSIIKNENAHDAGITCMVLIKENNGNCWIVTGSFDKTVKIWSTDVKICHILSNFISTVTSICFIPRIRTIWVTAGLSSAILFEPKSGENVSESVGTFHHHHQEEEKYQLQIIKYYPELSSVLGSTSRRHLIFWKYNSSGCVTALQWKHPLESLCYTQKAPILIFSGDSNGTIIKWERMQSNFFMYSKDLLVCEKSKSKSKNKRHQSSFLEEIEEENKVPNLERKVKSRYAFNKPMIPPVASHQHANKTILKMLFVESLDYIVAASEDGNIYVWGFDSSVIKALQIKDRLLCSAETKFAVLLDTDNNFLENQFAMAPDSVTNRVAGFTCCYILKEHTSTVTSIVALEINDPMKSGTYLLSGGWDRRICLWNLKSGRLEDTFKNLSTNVPGKNVELASDGAILDMDYCPPNMEFAYGTSDRMVYIRTFSDRGYKMALRNTLQGHQGDVTAVKWNFFTEKWVTGSDDGTIRIWSGNKMNECEQVLSIHAPVYCLTIDHMNGSIITGTHHCIKVFEAEYYRLVQTNVGHTDCIRSIIHVPERNQYVSCSWDQTVRIWNAWKMPRERPPPDLKTTSFQELISI